MNNFSELKISNKVSDTTKLTEIASVYVYILKDQEMSIEYERVTEMVDTIDRLSQEVLVSYTFIDLKKKLKIGTTKTKRLSHKDYKILASISHIQMILSHTSVSDYEKDKHLIFQTILREAGNFATLKILSKHAKSALDSCLIPPSIN